MYFVIWRNAIASVRNYKFFINMVSYTAVTTLYVLTTYLKLIRYLYEHPLVRLFFNGLGKCNILLLVLALLPLSANGIYGSYISAMFPHEHYSQGIYYS